MREEVPHEKGKKKEMGDVLLSSKRIKIGHKLLQQLCCTLNSIFPAA